MGNAGREAKGAVSATGNVTGKGVMGAASAIKNRVTRKKTNGGSNNKTRKKGGSLTTPVVAATDAGATPDVTGTDAGTNATNTGAEGAVVEGPQQSQETPAVAEPVAAATTNAGTNADA